MTTFLKKWLRFFNKLKRKKCTQRIFPCIFFKSAYHALSSLSSFYELSLIAIIYYAFQTFGLSVPSIDSTGHSFLNYRQIFCLIFYVNVLIYCILFIFLLRLITSYNHYKIAIQYTDDCFY